MFETMLEKKSDFNKFVNILHEHKLSIENKVMSEGSEELDTLMISYNGRISSKDLVVIKLAFSADKVSIGGEYIAVKLPPEMHDETDW